MNWKITRFTREAKCGVFGASGFTGTGSAANIARSPSRPKPAADWRSSARRGSSLVGWGIPSFYNA